MIEGKRLSERLETPRFVEEEVSNLESLSREVADCCGKRQEELEQALEQWRNFNVAMNDFKEVLAEGEVELTRKKSVNVTGIDLINEQQHDMKVGLKH